MWTILCVILIVIELAILSFFVINKIKKGKLHQTFIFLVLVFVCNLALYLIPYIYELVELKNESNHVLDILACVMDSITLFVGDYDIDFAKEFSEVTYSYTFAYLLGAILALLGTISTALEVFNARIVNSFKVRKCFKQEYCDIVLFDNELSLKYAKNNPNSVLLLDEKKYTKDDYNSLIKKGYIVIRKTFNIELLTSKIFNDETRYNIICPTQQDEFFKIIETFISYKKSDKQKKNIELFVEISEEKVETVKREIIEKNGLEKCINVFSRNELMVRDFVEKHPITEHLPKEFIDEDTSIKLDKKINVFFLGFSKLNEELYRQFIINNQLVCYEKEYKVFPINYQIYEERFDRSNIISINELKNDLLELEKNKEDYYPLPELPYNTTYHFKKSPLFKDNLNNVINMINENNSYSYIIIDMDDEYKNIELGVKIKTLLAEKNNYHIFVRNGNNYTKDDNDITYFGNFKQYFNHDVIVKERLAKMAKTLNKVYFTQQMADQKDDPNFEELVNKKAEESWDNSHFFTIFSNISSAISLRVKLNLLGLNYFDDGKGNNIDLINKKYIREDNYDYQDYFTKSIRNALLAQEHARWNAYHLLNDFLPLSKSSISVKNQNETNVSFNLKNLNSKKHACLTSFNGLNVLSNDLASKASKLLNKKIEVETYDLYKYDESLMLSVSELMEELKYSIEKKK